jgi:hypothetical protein
MYECIKKNKEKNMKKLAMALLLATTILVLSACGETNPCGEGTELVGNECVLVDDSNQNPSPTDAVCSNETGLHSVPGLDTISSWLNWRFIGGHIVTDPDNAWIQSYGAAVFNVHTVTTNAWEGSFTNSGMFLTEGCEYTFEFTLRTEVPNVKPNVIVFGENTSGVSFFEEEVDLNQTSTTYSFTVIPETSDYASTGVYFGGSKGMVIIEGIDIQRNPIGTN